MEDYYVNLVPRTVQFLFNIRMDPFESYDSKDSYGHLMQKTRWMMAPMGELGGATPEDDEGLSGDPRR